MNDSCQAAYIKPCLFSDLQDKSIVRSEGTVLQSIETKGHFLQRQVSHRVFMVLICHALYHGYCPILLLKKLKQIFHKKDPEHSKQV